MVKKARKAWPTTSQARLDDKDVRKYFNDHLTHLMIAVRKLKKWK